jgi:hypothetical protein
VRTLDEHKGAAFSVTQAKSVDIHGEAVDLDARITSDPTPEGLVNGLEFLHRIVAGDKLILHFSGIMMRSAALAATGPFDIPHSKDTIDSNLYLRMAGRNPDFNPTPYLLPWRRNVSMQSAICCGRVVRLRPRIEGGWQTGFSI